MSLTKFQKMRFAAWSAWNQTIGRFFAINLYGVKLFGIQITPKAIADILMEPQGEFSDVQLNNYHILLVLRRWYVFVPRLL